ncbi:MAG: 3-phosphoserine/phosphohydroxythreonine transaminase [Proteobacteria bacterium]|nr:3-phosphoserine/phosphohydroxythreonine transaminase [Pseudomonadota bacterium]
MARVYNFSAGPSTLPESVLEICAKEMMDCHGTGQSVMEMSHRSKAYEPIIEGCEAKIRELMQIPDNYKVLFLQGGASLQFAMIPLNLKQKGKVAFVDTGVWAKKAIDEAKRFMDVVDVVASSRDKGCNYIPHIPEIKGDYDYVHITINNTIVGTKWGYLPDTGDVPLVADISSSILSEPLDVSRFGLLYAGAQKNLAPAGVTLVIIREDLIREDLPNTVPTMLRYDTHANEGSMFNTPPTYTIYVMGLVLDWIKANGGAEGMAKRNYEKANLFYDHLEKSSFYRPTTALDSRSIMNIPFVFTEEDAEKVAAMNKKFVKEAAAAGLVNLAGHRLVGGMRASMYNAMSLEGVKALIAFMDKFEAENK